MKALNITPELMVEDLKVTVEFYTTVLDFELTTSFPEDKPFFAIIKNGEVSLMLYERKQFSDEIPSFRDIPLASSMALYLEINDIDKVYLTIQDKVKVIQLPHVTNYNTKEFSFYDCNGYVVILSQNL